MTERDDNQEQSQHTVAETTTEEKTTAVGETPTDPAEEKRVQPAEALESQRTVTETTETTETVEAPSSDSSDS